MNRRLLVPAVSTAVMMVLLLGLGTWQIQRLHWKEAILARIAAAERAPGIPLPPDPALFTKVRVTGTFDPARVAWFGADVHDTLQTTALGADLIVPLLRPGHLPVLVDRGWVPTEPAYPYAKPEGPVRIDGFIRLRDRPGPFVPANEPAQRRFYWIDPQAIGRSLGLPRVAPFVLVAMGDVPRGRYPMPARHLPQPPNNHLEYAMTWYGFALVLLIIFVRWTATNRGPSEEAPPRHAVQHRL